MNSICVVVADDHELIRTGLRAAIGAEDGLLLVGEATDGETTREVVNERRPDVLLLDLRMPGADPVDIVHFVQEHAPNTRVLVLTAHSHSDLIRSVVAAGVSGYLLKDESNQAVVEAIRVVARGGTWFNQEVVNALTPTSNAHRPVIDEQPSLTQREWEVLELVAQGCKNEQIAEMLVISERTVRFHLRNIRKKLGIRSRDKVIAWAARMGFGSNGFPPA